MDIIVSGRHLTVTDELKNTIENKLHAICDERPVKISKARVILSMEKQRAKAECILNMKHHTIEACVETYDMYESIDNMMNKIETQLNRYLDKVQSHHK